MWPTHSHGFLLLCWFLLVGHQCCADSGQTRNTELASEMAVANIQTALKIYSINANARQNENVFFSPFSISNVMAVLFEGAKGKTAQEIMQLLHWKSLTGDMSAAFEDYLNLLKQESSNYTLKTSNRLFIDSHVSILDSFLHTTAKHYHAAAMSADFQAKPESERAIINSIVEEETSGKIKDILQPGMVDPETVMVLVNAVYFKGSWAHPFDPQLTDPGHFLRGDGSTVITEMMHLKKRLKLGFHDNLRCSVLELPYVGQHMSMFIVLPGEERALTELEGALTADLLSELIQSTEILLVDVTIPKFTIQSSMDLKGTLTSLGLHDVFDSETADLSGIDGTELLYVSNAVHKAFVEVNEEGTEAAAATAATITKRSIEWPETFTADRPFLFFIRDNRADIILFMGRLVNPPSLDQANSKSKDEL